MPFNELSNTRPFSVSYIFGKTVKIGVLLAVLYYISTKDYLLFHSLTEFIGAVMGASIFLLAWNSRRFTNNSFYIFVGSFFLSAAVLEVLHALSYRGMTVFQGTFDNANLATQIWLANQFILAAGFVAAPFMVSRKVKPIIIIAIWTATSLLFVMSIFWWKNFPQAYVEGTGLTHFKNLSEYLVAAVFLLSAYLFFQKRRQLEVRVANMFALVSVLFAISTILFTKYINVSSSINALGHLVRLSGIYPVYIAVIEFGLMEPYKFLFGNLKKREEMLKKNEKLYRGVVEDQSELICRFLPDGKLTFVNDAYCRYYGKSREKLLDKVYFENLPPEIIKEEIQRLSKFTPENPVQQVEHQAIDKSGWLRWQHWTTRAIFDGGKKVVKFQSVGRDITDQKFTEEALRKSEQNFRSLVDNSLVGIYQLDKDGNYKYVNEAMVKMFEFESADEMIRENVKNRYGDIQERESFLRQINEKGKISNYEAVGKTKRGNKIVVLASVTKIGDNITGIVTDITTKRRNEEALKKAAEEWKMTFNSISDLIFILDMDHNVLRGNKAVLDFLGKSEEELIGKKCYEIVHKLHSPWKSCPLAKTKKTGMSHTEEVDDPETGKVLLVTTSPIKNNHGEIIGATHIAKDITERKNIEKAKDEFISLASHQLKTPLSSIALSSELLLRGTGGEIDPVQKEYLEEIFKAVKKMTLLVNNLLNVSRVEMGNFEVKSGPFNIASAVRSSVKEFTPIAAEKNLTVDVQIESNIPIVNLDERSFGIIFDNILSNAIRYTPKQGSIKIELKKEGTGILLSISDTGCGIPKKQERRIFSKSFRADNAKEISSEGAGLGLYMSRIVAQKCGAKIWFESEEGKGTKFFVLFSQ